MDSIITILIIAAVVVVLYFLFKVFKFITRLILIAIFLGLVYITNPGLERHEKAVEAKAESTHTNIRGWHVSVQNLQIASLTRITKGDESRLVGVGMLTQVWIFRDLK